MATDAGTDPGPGPKKHTSTALDPDFKEALRSARLSTRGWKTDFSLHSVPFDEIFSGGPPRDGIPLSTNPSLLPLGTQTGGWAAKSR